MLNRTQALVLGFFLVAVVSVVAIRLAVLEVYDQATSADDLQNTAAIPPLVDGPSRWRTSTGGVGSPLRRPSARTLATSSLNANGLPRQALPQPR